MMFSYSFRETIDNSKKKENGQRFTYTTLPVQFSYEDIVNRIQNGEYGAVYGVFTLMEKEEIIKEFNEVIIESEYDTYMNNFYEDDTYIYLIVDDVMATNYAILRFMK